MEGALKRGQVSVEFVIIIAILLLLFVALFTMYNHQRENAWLAQQQMDATLVAHSISLAMMQVIKEGGNASTEVFLPTFLAHGENYSVYVDNKTRLLSVSWGSFSKEFSLPTSRFISEYIESGTVVISNGDVIDIA